MDIISIKSKLRFTDTFPILRRIERDTIINVQKSSCTVTLNSDVLYPRCVSTIVTAETCRRYNPNVILEANIVVFDCKYQYTKLLTVTLVIL